MDLLPVAIGVLGLVMIRRVRLLAGWRVLTGALFGIAKLDGTFVMARLASPAAEAPEYFSVGQELHLFLKCASLPALLVLPWATTRIVRACNQSSWHLEWIVLSVFPAVSKLSRSGRTMDNYPLLAPLAAITAYSAYVRFLNLSAPRVDAPAESVAAGMQITPDLGKEMTEDFALLDDHVELDLASYLTKISDLSISRGRFTSADPYFTVGTFSHFSRKESALPSPSLLSAELGSALI